MTSSNLSLSLALCSEIINKTSSLLNQPLLCSRLAIRVSSSKIRAKRAVVSKRSTIFRSTRILPTSLHRLQLLGSKNPTLFSITHTRQKVDILPSRPLRIGNSHSPHPLSRTTAPASIIDSNSSSHSKITHKLTHINTITR